MRTFKKADGRTYYSTWSRTKATDGFITAGKNMRGAAKVGKAVLFARPRLKADKLATLPFASKVRIRKEKNIRLELAQGITLALSFKMGGEVLRTVVVREWEELGILGAIIVLRAALTFLLHWEIENEKKDQDNLEEVCCECGHVHKKDENHVACS